MWCYAFLRLLCSKYKNEIRVKTHKTRLQTAKRRKIAKRFGGDFAFRLRFHLSIRAIAFNLAAVFAAVDRQIETRFSRSIESVRVLVCAAKRRSRIKDKHTHRCQKMFLLFDKKIFFVCFSCFKRNFKRGKIFERQTARKRKFGIAKRGYQDFNIAV